MNTHRDTNPSDADRESVTLGSTRESGPARETGPTLSTREPGPASSAQELGPTSSAQELGPTSSARESHRVAVEGDPVWERLTEQLHWYGSKSAAARRAYRRVELCQILVGAMVPVFAGLSAPPQVTATVATAVVVSEGAQQLFQWHTHWLLYRSTAEALKREKYLFLAGAGRYGDPDARTVLAQRVESILASTNTTWAAEHDRPGPSTPSPLVVPVKY